MFEAILHPTSPVGARNGRPSLRTILASALTVFLAGPAWSGEWYVDAVNGDNTANGQSPATAWRTLTHTLTVGALPQGQQHTVHVAPGTYDPALGENFPRTIPARTRLHSTGGSAVTFLVGNGVQTSAILSCVAGEEFDTGASGFTLLNARNGLAIGGSSETSKPGFDDIIIEGMTEAGVSVRGQTTPHGAGIPAHPVLTNCMIVSCEVGVRLYGNAAISTAGAIVTLRDSTIRESVTDGLRVEASSLVQTHAVLERSRVELNGRNGVFLESIGSEITVAGMTARDTLIARNGQQGIHGVNAHDTFGLVVLEDCTIAHNGGVGVSTQNRFTTRFRGTVVAGNHPDVRVSLPLDAEYCNSPSGNFLGLLGGIAADPLFVDPNAGDFRLAWGSPCIDSGDPLIVGGVDLRGQERPLDGDLDTVARRDMGALEFRPLDVHGVANLGGNLECESWGEPGASLRLLVTAAAPVPPTATPFGRLDLNRSLIVLRPLPSLPGSSRLDWQLRLPTAPSWIGNPISMQTLTGSSSAPFGSALSNTAAFVIQP